MNKVVLDGISANMASLVQLGKYGAINASDTTKMGYYVIKYLSKPYTLKDYQTACGKVSKACQCLVIEEYISITKAKTNWYWQQHKTNQRVIISTHIIVHPCIDVLVIKMLQTIPGVYAIKTSTPGCTEITNLYR